MTTTLAKPTQAESIERVLIMGDLGQLSAEQKTSYYLQVCESLGLNPYTKPFDYLRLNGREILYARKDATDQLRKINRVSIASLEREQIGDLMVVTANAEDGTGRKDSAIGAVSIAGLKGEALANALMKAETKAKRRVTLSICGLGLTDETEVDSIPGAERMSVDVQTGEVLEPPVKMVTSVKSRLYQRYATLVEQAAALEVEYEAPELPISEAELTRLGVDLAERIASASTKPDESDEPF